MIILKILQDVMDRVTVSFTLLHVRIVSVEREFNRLEPFLEISTKNKVLDANIGPLDAITVVMDSKLHFKVIVYAELLEEGTLLVLDDVANLRILQKMNNRRFYVCEGVCEYSEYKKVLDMIPRMLSTLYYQLIRYVM